MPSSLVSTRTFSFDTTRAAGTSDLQRRVRRTAWSPLLMTAHLHTAVPAEVVVAAVAPLLAVGAVVLVVVRLHTRHPHTPAWCLNPTPSTVVRPTDARGPTRARTTKSRMVKPSCAVMKLMLWNGLRLFVSYRSAEPDSRLANSFFWPSSPCRRWFVAAWVRRQLLASRCNAVSG